MPSVDETAVTNFRQSFSEDFANGLDPLTILKNCLQCFNFPENLSVQCSSVRSLRWFVLILDNYFSSTEKNNQEFYNALVAYFSLFHPLFWSTSSLLLKTAKDFNQKTKNNLQENSFTQLHVSPALLLDQLENFSKLFSPQLAKHLLTIYLHIIKKTASQHQPTYQYYLCKFSHLLQPKEIENLVLSDVLKQISRARLIDDDLKNIAPYLTQTQLTDKIFPAIQEATKQNSTEKRLTTYKNFSAVMAYFKAEKTNSVGKFLLNALDDKNEKIHITIYRLLNENSACFSDADLVEAICEKVLAKFTQPPNICIHACEVFQVLLPLNTQATKLSIQLLPQLLKIMRLYDSNISPRFYELLAKTALFLPEKQVQQEIYPLLKYNLKCEDGNLSPHLTLGKIYSLLSTVQMHETLNEMVKAIFSTTHNLKEIFNLIILIVPHLDYYQKESTLKFLIKKACIVKEEFDENSADSLELQKSACHTLEQFFNYVDTPKDKMRVLACLIEFTRFSSVREAACNAFANLMASFTKDDLEQTLSDIFNSFDQLFSETQGKVETIYRLLTFIPAEDKSLIERLSLQGLLQAQLTAELDITDSNLTEQLFYLSLCEKIDKRFLFYREKMQQNFINIVRPVLQGKSDRMRITCLIVLNTIFDSKSTVQSHINKIATKKRALENNDTATASGLKKQKKNIL